MELLKELLILIKILFNKQTKTEGKKHVGMVQET